MVAAEAVFDWLGSEEKQAASKEVTRYQTDMEASWVRSGIFLYSFVSCCACPDARIHTCPPTPGISHP